MYEFYFNKDIPFKKQLNVVQMPAELPVGTQTDGGYNP